MKPREIVLCHPVRTAIGTYGGSLKDIPAPHLGAVVIQAALERSSLTSSDIHSVVMGNVIQAGNGMNPARQACLGAGLPITTPALTVNRVCGSGAQAIVTTANEIYSGMIDCAIAGGMENMDRAPYLMAQGRWGARMGDVTLVDSMLRDGLNDAFSHEHSGWHTEDLVKQFNLSREDQDQWALRSQQRFYQAQSSGHFSHEIVGVQLTHQAGTGYFDQDEHNRPTTTRETLAKLKPVFRKDGTITAGNSPGLNSGASAMIVAERIWAEKRKLEPAARIISYGISAVDPGYFGLAPITAVQLALRRANWKITDVDRIEINEAFSAITLICMRELGLPEDKVNVDGGAIAHGHPIGASGAVLITKLIHSMRRDGLKRGVVTLCIGGGQGIALAIEMV